MEMAGGFWTAFMYFGPILFSYLLPPLITVQVQLSRDSWETVLIAILNGGFCPVYYRFYIFLSRSVLHTFLCSKFWEANFYGLTSS